MHWNYRLIRRKGANGEVTVGIHEVHYDKDGDLHAYAETPVQLEWDLGEDPQCLLDKIQKAFTLPVLTEDSF